ncbi:hypothetical protein [Burkholderia sp. Nafp2/4-1b]|uniref:hypothetical protein n=1 Tax=Burkholderia sp. Nafp2/4-1b TaxID=2116686 RepID=UPI0013CEA61E|nr:hypothetical protein [Burkholderia sp. Nafp2/4-1b]
MSNQIPGTESLAVRSAAARPGFKPKSTTAWITFSRSTSRIVMVIVPVAFIAGAPKGADDQPTGQNTTFLFSGNATSELGTYIAQVDNYESVYSLHMQRWRRYHLSA